MIEATTIQTPIGNLDIVGRREADREVVLHLTLPEGSSAPRWAELERREDALPEVRRQIEEYFAGRRRDFDLAVDGEGTDFQQLVWSELAKIPYGETRSYAEVAVAIGRPAAVRAVGAANGRNPIPIVVPCHRVIGADGSLTGFGGGLEAKRWLLELEGAWSGEEQESLWGPG